MNYQKFYKYVLFYKRYFKLIAFFYVVNVNYLINFK
jgi:hypothetical protein